MSTLVTLLIAIVLGVVIYILMQLIIGYLEKPKHPKTALAINLIGAILLCSALAIIYIYFFVISPTFIEKPYLEKPELYVRDPSQEIINKYHIQWLANELGGYKLHDDPISKTVAEFEFVVTDFQKTYTVKIVNNNVNTFLGPTSNADGRIFGSQGAIIKLFQSNDFKNELVSLAKQGELQVELFRDETTLALKGYKVLYDEFN